MLKGYRVQMERKDNRTGRIFRYKFSQENSFSSCKECYLDAANILMHTASYPGLSWVMVGYGLLATYADERTRVQKVKEFVHTSEYYTYIVTINCEE